MLSHLINKESAAMSRRWWTLTMPCGATSASAMPTRTSGTPCTCGGPSSPTSGPSTNCVSIQGRYMASPAWALARRRVPGLRPQ